MPKTEYTLNVQYIPEKLENPNNFPVIKCLYFRRNTNQTVAEAAVLEANQMLPERNVPYLFQFIFV